MKVKVKICGIQTLETVQFASDAGADFVGFNFVSTSKRYIKPEAAKKISSCLRSNNIKLVGVFQNEKIDAVNKLINYLDLDYVQLHGDESAEYVNRIDNAGIIKTFPLETDFNIEETIKKMKKYSVDYFLLDRKEQGRGKLLNPEKVRQLALMFPIILAGGLTIENVADIVKMTKPQAVDVAGGVETDGKKDEEKIIKFVKRAKGIYSSSDERSEESRSLHYKIVLDKLEQYYYDI